MTSKKSKGKGKGSGKGNRGSFDCVSRKCAASFAQDDTIFLGSGGQRQGKKQVPCGDDKQEKQRQGDSNSNSNSNGNSNSKGNRGSFDCVSRKSAAYFAQDDTIFFGWGGQRQGKKQVPFGDDNKKGGGEGKGKGEGKGRSRSPAGMTTRKARARARAKEEADALRG